MRSIRVQFLVVSLLFLTIVFVIHGAHGGNAKPHLCMLPHSMDGYREPKVWRCNGQLPLWSYDVQRNECVEFRYGGCGGNDNSFFTRENCEETCRR